MDQTKICPYCGEEILAVAKKCKHCGEWLDGTHSDRHQGKGVPQKNNKKKFYYSIALFVGLCIVGGCFFLFCGEGRTSHAPNDIVSKDSLRFVARLDSLNAELQKVDERISSLSSNHSSLEDFEREDAAREEKEDILGKLYAEKSMLEIIPSIREKTGIASGKIDNVDEQAYRGIIGKLYVKAGVLGRMKALAGKMSINPSHPKCETQIRQFFVLNDDVENMNLELLSAEEITNERILRIKWLYDGLGTAAKKAGDIADLNFVNYAIEQKKYLKEEFGL